MLSYLKIFHFLVQGSADMRSIEVTACARERNEPDENICAKPQICLGQNGSRISGIKNSQITSRLDHIPFKNTVWFFLGFFFKYMKEHRRSFLSSAGFSPALLFLPWSFIISQHWGFFGGGFSQLIHSSFLFLVP